MTTQQQQQVHTQKIAVDTGAMAVHLRATFLTGEELAALFAERDDRIHAAGSLMEASIKLRAECVALTTERDELRTALKGLLAVIPEDYRVTIMSRVDRARKAVGL